MKTVAGFLIVVSFVVGFISCQKEIDGGVTNNPQSDSSYLDKLFALDTTLPSGMDTVEKAYFIYDNSKRLGKLTDYFFGPSYTDTSIREFFYSGNSTTPYKEIYNDFYSSAHEVDTIYYTFSNGVVTKDSIISWILSTNSPLGVRASDYVSQGNSVSIYYRDYSLISGNYVLVGSNISTCTTTYSGGNQISQIRTSGYSTFNNVQVTYDNKLNPFAKVLKNKYPYFGSYPGFDWLVQNNNPKTIHYQEQPSDPYQDEQYTYIYRADNYPSSATFFSNQGWPSNKFLFFYKSL
jgi:hypothetical protein